MPSQPVKNKPAGGHAPPKRPSAPSTKAKQQTSPNQHSASTSSAQLPPRKNSPQLPLPQGEVPTPPAKWLPYSLPLPPDVERLLSKQPHTEDAAPDFSSESSGSPASTPSASPVATGAGRKKTKAKKGGGAKAKKQKKAKARGAAAKTTTSPPPAKPTAASPPKAKGSPTTTSSSPATSFGDKFVAVLHSPRKMMRARPSPEDTFTRLSHSNGPQDETLALLLGLTGFKPQPRSVDLASPNTFGAGGVLADKAQQPQQRVAVCL